MSKERKTLLISGLAALLMLFVTIQVVHAFKKTTKGVQAFLRDTQYETAPGGNDEEKAEGPMAGREATGAPDFELLPPRTRHQEAIEGDDSTLPKIAQRMLPDDSPDLWIDEQIEQTVVDDPNPESQLDDDTRDVSDEDADDDSWNEQDEEDEATADDADDLPIEGEPSVDAEEEPTNPDEAADDPDAFPSDYEE